MPTVEQYDSLIKRRQDNEQTQLKVNMDAAVRTNPDQHAKVLNLSEQTGLDPSLIEGHEDEVDLKARQRAVDYDKLLKDSPKLSRFLSDPNNAKLAHDDVDNLSWFETIGTGIAHRATGLAGGLSRFVGTTSATLARNLEERLPLGTVVIDSNGISWRPSQQEDLQDQGFVQGSTEFFTELQTGINYQPGTSWDDVKKSPLSEFIPFAIEQGLVSIPDMAAVMVALPAYVAARTGELGQERAQNDKREEATVEDFITVAPFAVASAALERLGTRGILGLDDTVKQLVDVPGAVAAAAGKEAITEAAQESLESVAETAGTEKGFSLTETAERALAGAVGGGPFGGLVRTATATGEIMMNRVNADQVAQDTYDRLKDLGDRAKESQLFARNKDRFAQFMQEASEDAEVFLNVNDARELFQSANTSPAEVYKELGITDQVTEAAVSGGDLVIPLGKLAALADKPYFDEMIKDVRLAQSDISVREAESRQGEYEAYVEEVAKQVEERNQDIDAFTQSADRVYEGFKADLEATGKYAPDVVERYALLHRAFAVAFSDRMGIMPEDIYQQYGVKVVDAALSEDQKAQVETIRAGDVPDMLKDADIEQLTDREIIDAITPMTGTNLNDDVTPSNIQPQEPGLDLGQTPEVDPAVFKFQAFQNTGDKRGSILIPKDFAEGDAVIRLFENANLSTFLHESGHYFLEVYKDIVSRETTPQGLKDDFQAILDWMGVESADQIGVDQHEQFARGFEAYLFEGKAPSAELQSVFSRFRAWLVQIYRSMRNLDVQLSDEVRGVFDRMLATDEAIQQTEDNSLYLPIFDDAKAAGMTEAEYNAYVRAYTKAHDAAVRDLEKQNLDEIRREEREAYRNEKEQVSNQVAERLAQNKAIRAKEFLMRGTFPQGELPEGMEAFKLNKQALIDQYGTDGITRRLPQGKNRVTAEDGIDPDTAAGILGFTSGDELIQALVATPSYRQAVREQVRAIMKERHGDLMGKPEEMAEAAISATHNDERADFMVTELKALEKRANLRITPKQVIRNVAKRIISEKPASGLREGHYMQASIRAANEAIRETAAGNYPVAADAKRRQILNHYLYMEARDARIKSEKIQKYMRRVQTRKYDPKRVNPSYITQLKLLASTYNFSKSGDQQRAKQNLINLVRWVQGQQNADGFIIPEILDPNLARIASAIELSDSQGQDINKLMDAIDIQPFGAMTIDELESVYNQARHLRFIGGQLSEASRAELTAEAAYLADVVRENGGKDVKRITDKDWLDKAKDIAKRVSYDQVKLLSDIRQFDGFEDFGPLFESIYRPIVEGTNTRIESDLKAINDLKDIFKPIEKSLKPKNDIRTITKQKTGEWSLSLRERIMLAVYWGSPESREAIIQGHAVTEQDVHNMLKTLTDEQFDLVESIWAYNETFWSELSRIEAKVNGVPPAKVEHVPFEVNGRKLPGGYQRIFYHWDVRDKFKIDMNDEANKAMNMNKVTMSKTGATIARVGSGGREIRLDVDNVFRAVEDNLQFIAFAEASRKVARMAQHPTLANAIIEKYGQERYQSFIDSIDGVFAGNVNSNHPINAMMRGVRTNLTFGYLALSVRNMVQQPVALTNVMGKVGEVETLKAVADFYMHPTKWNKVIKEKSPFMNQRNRYINREASEQLARITKGGGLGWRPQWAFIFQTIGDAVVTYPAWLAGYRQGLKMFSKPGVSEAKAEADARIYADEIVASTVGSGLSKDLPPLFQGSGSVAQVVGPEAVKQLTFMGTFFNMTYNLYFDAWKRADFKSAKSSINFVREMAWYSVIPGILSALVTEGLPDDDDDEGLWEWAAKASAEFGFSASMFWRNFVGAFKGFEPNIPATKAVTGTVRAFNLAADIITDEKELDKAALAKFIRDFEPIIAIPGGGQAARTLEYLDSFEQGNEDAFSVQGLLITGKKR